MLRKVTMLLSVIVIAWWVGSGDPHALKRAIVDLRDGHTRFAPDDAAQRNDWGDG